MADTDTKTKTSKTGTCLVTGQPTKGGKFLPGMDAKYVSLRVKEVVSGEVQPQVARTRIQNETGSEALLAKFDRSLALAREKAERKRQAAAEREAARANKTDGDAASAAKKAAAPAAKKATASAPAKGNKGSRR